MNFKELLEEYNYELPEELIAQEPAQPRDSARLLVYDRKTNATSFDTFKNLTHYLPPQSLLVFNQTKVLPARLHVSKPTGGKVEIFYVKTISENIQVMANRPLSAGTVLSLDSTQTFTVVEQQEKYFLLKPSFPIDQMFKVLEQYGVTPIPPYIKHSSLSESDLRQQYQTVFAKDQGSVAAPTASLHFTDELLQKIKNAGHEIVFVTLHVNLGTFAPLTPEHVASNSLHEEWYEIPQESIQKIQAAKTQMRPVIAVGTTVVRTLESAARQGDKGNWGDEGVEGETTLFINEGFTFKIVDGMITNFHVPKSSLLMLVAALVGREKLFELYQKAIQQKFRFFSFGDGMLIKG